MGLIDRAAGDGDLERLKALLAEDPELVHSENCDGWTPLIFACINGHASIAQFLLEKGSRVDATEMGGVTALYQCCFDGHVGCAEVLLRHGANPSSKALDGMTPLHQAAAAGHAPLVRCLIKHGAGVNDVDNAGKTALLYACEKDNADAVEALLEGGADYCLAMPSNKAASGSLLPIDIATSRGHADVVAALKEAERSYLLVKARAVHDDMMHRERRPQDPLPDYLSERTEEVLPRVEVHAGEESGGGSGHARSQEVAAASVLVCVLELNPDMFRELMPMLGGRKRA